MDARFGDVAQAGILCMVGSAMYLMTTGMSKSQARMLLSSEVVTNLSELGEALVNHLTNLTHDEPATLVGECNSIHRTQMLIVFLCDFAGPSIVLDDLLVRHARKEDVGLLRIRLESNTVRDLAVGEGLFALSCLLREHASANNSVHYQPNEPVSVSHSFICLSKPADKNSVPSGEKSTSRTAAE